jgi:dihydrofolate reductase
MINPRARPPGIRVVEVAWNFFGGDVEANVRPGRGEWDLDWTGWWGDEPRYHAPVFVLTHHEREPVEMKGSTAFHFVTGGITEALDRARAAAGNCDVAIAGRAATVNQYLAAGLIAELCLHIAPVVRGQGERLFEGVGRVELAPVEARHTNLVTHVRYATAKRGAE